MKQDARLAGLESYAHLLCTPALHGLELLLLRPPPNVQEGIKKNASGAQPQLSSMALSQRASQ